MSPKGPRSFLARASRGGFRGPGLQLILAWLGFHVLGSTFWASHIRKLVGNSSLATYWGEHLNSRDLWELWVNAGLSSDPLGTLTLICALAFLAWALWAGWRVQEESVNRKAKLSHWVLGFIDALLIGLFPIALMAGALTWGLEQLALTGIQCLGWMNLIGGNLLKLMAAALFLFQWWICRATRAEQEHSEVCIPWMVHLGRSFLRFWKNFFQWTLLAFYGVMVRTGLHLLVLSVAWRMGGGSPFKVAFMLGLQVISVVASAWVIGVMLKATAYFVRHEEMVLAEIQRLESNESNETRVPEQILLFKSD